MHCFITQNPVFPDAPSDLLGSARQAPAHPNANLWLANCYFARDKSDNQNAALLHGVENLPPNQFARDRPQFHLLESR
jgi:hypothetical protein